MSVIRQRYEASARQEALGDLIQETFYEAVVEQKLNRPATRRRTQGVRKGQGPGIRRHLRSLPEFEVKGLDGIEIERQDASVEDADIDKMLDVLRKQGTRYEAVDRAAANDDQVTIDFVGTQDGEAFAGGSAEGTKLVLGSGRMIPGFEDGLVRRQGGDERVLDLTFPEDYQNLDLAGKAAQFKVTVKEVAPRRAARAERSLLQAVRCGRDHRRRFPRRSTQEHGARAAPGPQDQGQEPGHGRSDGCQPDRRPGCPDQQRSGSSARPGRPAVRRQHQPEQLPAELFSEQPSAACCWV